MSSDLYLFCEHVIHISIDVVAPKVYTHFGIFYKKVAHILFHVLLVV